MSEKSEVVAPALREIRRRGGKALKVQPTPMSGVEVGTPDIIGCYRGKMILIECKLPGEEPERIQNQRQYEWAAAGAYCIVADRLEDVITLLDLVDRDLEKIPF